jgi:DNA-binding transcriptional regulator GbsR (MarR family)
MHSPVQQFIERIALTLEADGLPRIAGRIFGFLLVHHGAHSLDDLAEALQASKASVSTNARLLEQGGLIQRVGAPGDRRDYYQMGDDAWERMLQVARRRWECMRQVMADGAALLPPEMEEGRRRLNEAENFHDLILEEAERLVLRWREIRERQPDRHTAPLMLVE